MTIHVNIAEAKARFSHLVEAALRGEDVIVQKAGVPKVKLVPIEDADRMERERIVARRMANIGKFREELRGLDLTVPPSMTDEEIEQRYKRKFG